MSKVMYALHPGHVKSRTDGNLHYITSGQLARLYKLKMNQYIVWKDIDDTTRVWDDYIHLYPRFDGNYQLPEVN